MNDYVDPKWAHAERVLAALCGWAELPQEDLPEPGEAQVWRVRALAERLCGALGSVRHKQRAGECCRPTRP